ncbi:MAG: hypothetical protein HKN37_07505 [Rhodothermales bacterium]|nr:hypothetical protein [Rhodothermales bacterium]
MYLRLFLWSLVAALAAGPSAAQDQPTGGALAVFLDCDRCDFSYIRREITFVNYVRDRTEAQVHILVTTERAGAGRAYTLDFIGLGRFAGLVDTLRYTSSDTDTDDERRSGLAQTIRLGLVRYVARTPLATQIGIQFDESRSDLNQASPEDDPWNFWVFRVGLDGSVDVEDVTDDYEIDGDVHVSRVTEDWKIRLSVDGSYEEENFDLEDGTVTSTRRDGSVRGLVVRSLNRHWSAGGFVRLSTSSFNNTAFSASISPSLEFNLFPYSESSRRQIRFSYFLDLRSFDYEELTVFDKSSEVLLHQQFATRLEFQQPWGEASASFEASSYLTDFDQSLLDLYRLQFFGFVQVRLVRGLSLFAFGRISHIRDQIFLSREEASQEEILLGSVRLPTSFEYRLSVGLSYTFGSIYNNIVNPRFGS